MSSSQWLATDGMMTSNGILHLLRRNLAGTLLAFAAACATAPLPDEAPRVAAHGATFEGLNLPGKAEGGRFLGIPFAAPPVGKLRWQPPQPIQVTPEHVQARSYAPACIQGDYTTAWYAEVIEAFGSDVSRAAVPKSESEDCLYLNVWSPDLTPDIPAPVMVWIHGGAYKGGWSYEPNYIGETLSAQRDVVIVSIAYRLGALGYLGPDATSADAPVNFGLMDQIAALKWVQANIAAFGGDPHAVTLFGESAGAASIGTLLTLPHSSGLYQRAISQSGGFEFLPLPDRDDAAAAFDKIAAHLRTAGTTPQDATGLQILSASNAALPNYEFGPVLDGNLLKRAPMESLAEGSINPVDLIIGTNRDEWLMYLDQDTAEEDLVRWTSSHPEASDLITKLRNAYGTPGALDRLETAAFMRCPGQSLAKTMSTAGKSVYVYEFNRARSGAIEAGLGSYHGAEIPYVFDTHDVWLPTDEVDRSLTEFMTDAWTRFAAIGHPSPEWPDFSAGGNVLILNQSRDIAPPTSAALCAQFAPAPGGTETE